MIRRGGVAKRPFLAGVVTALVGLLSTLPALASSPAAASQDVRISVDARGVPLGKLLREFAALARVDQLVVDRDLERILVSVKLDGVPAAEAFRAILTDAGVDFAIWGGEGPDLRIVAHAFDRQGSATNAASRGALAARDKSIEAMAAVAKGTEAADDPSEASWAPDPPAAQADPVSAFLIQGAPAAAPTSAATVENPGRAVPLMLPTSPENGIAGAGKPGSSTSADVPADLPQDPFARYLTEMSASKPRKQ
jgi:hypothetical protein